MKFKSQILQHPEIPILRSQYEAVDRDFDSAMNRAIVEVPKVDKTTNQIIEIIIDLLWSYLHEKPATTRGGRILRAVVNVLKKIWP